MFIFIDDIGVSKEERNTLVLNAYRQMKQTVDKYGKSDGSQKRPAKNCADLSENYPEYKSGKYFINPSTEDINEALEVHCDMQAKATCLIPTTSKFREMNPHGIDPEIWLGEIDNGISITYKATSKQIEFLQLHSKRATQNVTYHCKRSVAVYNKEKNSFRQGMKLLAYNDAEVTAKGPQRLRYDVVQDDCKVSVIT